jgi:hypothetical protein
VPCTSSAFSIPKKAAAVHMPHLVLRRPCPPRLPLGKQGAAARQFLLRLNIASSSPFDALKFALIEGSRSSRWSYWPSVRPQHIKVHNNHQTTTGLTRTELHITSQSLHSVVPTVFTVSINFCRCLVLTTSVSYFLLDNQFFYQPGITNITLHRQFAFIYTHKTNNLTN